MKRYPKVVPGSMLYGLLAVARFAGLTEAEAMRRIESGELPCEFAGNVPIAEKAKLREIMATPHFRRAA
jgi:hypothetical protein